MYNSLKKQPPSRFNLLIRKGKTIFNESMVFNARGVEVSNLEIIKDKLF